MSLAKTFVIQCVIEGYASSLAEAESLVISTLKERCIRHEFKYPGDEVALHNANLYDMGGSIRVIWSWTVETDE